ncbi:hypothetical protein AB9K35_17595 [Leisingera sp. XS_AS12]|uniref:hypothetical protein n=1 Tax=Leisingera sp. XS_AS12 TaxID=3241294 RepID=UPI003513AA42
MPFHKRLRALSWLALAASFASVPAGAEAPKPDIASLKLRTYMACAFDDDIIVYGFQFGEEGDVWALPPHSEYSAAVAGRDLTMMSGPNFIRFSREGGGISASAVVGNFVGEVRCSDVSETIVGHVDSIVEVIVDATEASAAEAPCQEGSGYRLAALSERLAAANQRPWDGRDPTELIRDATAELDAVLRACAN